VAQVGLKALGFLRKRRLSALWQPLLLLFLWGASLAFASVSGVAIAFGLSCLWPLAWRAGQQWSRSVARRSSGPFLEAGLALLGFAALTWGVLGFVIIEHVPVDRGDHHIMIARADLLMRALRHGHVAHWSHLFQGGDSLTDLYPVFLNWVTAIIHLLSPAGTAFVDSYSRLCVAAWGFRGFAAYTAARRFAGPLPSALVAVASLFDVGAEVFDGTWHGVFYWGMIHNNIALSLGLLALAFQLDLTRKVSSGGLFRCALFVSLAAIAHPLGMLFVTVSVAALAGATFIRARRFRRSLWALVASGLGLLLAGVWVLPYVKALSLHGFNGSLQGVDYGDLGHGLFDGSLPTSSYGGWIGFAVVALCCALGSRKVPRLAVGLLGISFVLLAVSPFLVQSRALEVFKSFLDAQQRRCLTVAKVALVPSLAWLLQQQWRGLSRRVPGAGVRAVFGRTLLIFLMVFGPARMLVRGFDGVANTLHEQLPVPADSKYGKRENDTDDTHRAAFNWIKARREADKSPTPWRMTYWDRFDQRMHAHWTWVQGLDTGVPLVDYGWVSANFIRYRPREMTPQGMLDWNIRYAIGLGSRPDVPGFSLVHQVGGYKIFEYDQYDDRFVLAPESVKISGLKVTEQSIEFDVSGAPASGVNVTARCAWFPRWRGTQAGRELSVVGVPPHPGALPGQEQLGLHVQNGHVVLDAGRTMPGYWAGLFASLLGLVGTALVVSRARHRTRVEGWVMRALDFGRRRLARARLRLEPIAGRLLLALALLLGLLLLLSPGTRLLSHPVVEGIGLRVTATSRAGSPLPCIASPLHGRYICGKGASVEAAQGITPPQDGSGEYGKFWPGMRVHFKESGARVNLSFRRVDARSGKLKLLSTVSGAVELVIHTTRGDVAPLRISGNQVQLVQLPAGLSRAETLNLELTSLGGGSDAILRGELQP
jgi:hypothetical protein